MNQIINHSIADQIAEQGGVEAYLQLQQDKACCVFSPAVA